MADSERRTEWTYTRVSGTNGEPNILIELSNEMDSVPLASDGVTSLSSTITSDVTMYKGLTELPATFTLTQSGNYATITRQGNTNTYTLSVVIPQSVTLTNDKYDVVITGTYGAYTRDRTFTVQGVRAGADGEGAVQYSLVPSVTTVNKDNSGQYSVPSVTCSVLRTLNDTRSLVDLSSTQDLVLKYLLDSSTTETIYSTAISTSSFTTQLTFRLYYQNILVDSETIPLLTDGEDGTSVLAKYSTTSSTAEESLWHTPFVSGDVWMRVSEDDGVSWGAPIRIVGENGADGTSPYSCSVSNENFTVATGTDLKPLSATTYSVRFQAYKGSTQLTAIAPSATIASGKFKVSTPTTAGFTVAQSTAGTLTFTTATGTAISANISTNVTVTYDNGSTETKTITISASKTGAQGTAAMFVSIEAADGLVFKNSSPSQLSLRCVATGFTPSSYQWYKDGTAITSATSQTYNATSAGVYKVTSNGYSDFVTVISVSDGEDGHSPVITASKQNGTTTISSDGTAIATIVDGDDGVSGVAIQCSQDSVVFPKLRNGKAHYQQKTFTIKLVSGDTTLNTTASISANITGNLNAVISPTTSAGEHTVTFTTNYGSIAPSGTVTITLTYNSTNYTKIITVSSVEQGKYLGLATAITGATVTIDSSSTPVQAGTISSGSNTATLGDYIVWKSTTTSSYTKTCCYAYVCTASETYSWTQDTSDTANMTALSDITTIITSTDANTIALLLVQRLAVNTAFINQLFAQYISVSGGIAVGARYNVATGAISDKTKNGAYIDSKGFKGRIIGDNDNILIGNNAGNSITLPSSGNTGSTGNILTGVSAGNQITTGNNNIVLGHTAGSAITTASGNVVIGEGALAGTSTGDANIVIGEGAGLNLTGAKNVVITPPTNVGQGLSSVTSGTNNIVIGTVLSSAITGSGNTIIGNNLEIDAPSESDNIRIGNSKAKIIINADGGIQFQSNSYNYLTITQNSINYTSQNGANGGGLVPYGYYDYQDSALHLYI